MPHAPDPQCERAADIVLGLVDALELMTFNPYDAQVSVLALADWYRWLNLGYALPLVGGSDKMSAASLLGGIRTYAHLGEREFDYGGWQASVRHGNTFVTVGPLVELRVEGRPPGTTLDLPAGGGTLEVAWRVESASVPVERVEVIVGGRVADDTMLASAEAPPFRHQGAAPVTVTEPTWVAARVRGSLRGRADDIAAHTSAVMVNVGGQRVFSRAEAAAAQTQIEGALAYLDTLAPRPAADRFSALRAVLASAHDLLHHRLHQVGVAH
jgi:hypothetical protein